MRVVSLASGSSGNALLIDDGVTRVLVDAGLPPRTLITRLRQVGVAAESLSAILLTHEHHDHTCGAVAFACRHDIPIVTDRRTFDALMTLPSALRVERTPACDALPVGRHKRLGSLDVRSFAVSHDAAAPCGYLLTSGGWTVFVATDTGEVTPPMADALGAARLVVIEANHDERMLHAGPYPMHLKRRIRGATGHLSNTQTADALVAATQVGPRWVWLAHLSRTNNTPAQALATVHQRLQEFGRERVVLAAAPPELGPTWESPESSGIEAHQPTLWSDATPPPADMLLEAPRVPAPNRSTVDARAARRS